MLSAKSDLVVITMPASQIRRYLTHHTSPFLRKPKLNRLDLRPVDSKPDRGRLSRLSAPRT